MMKNSFTHKRLKLKLENLIKDKKKLNIKKRSKEDISLFIGPTTGVIVALEKKIKVIHICFNEKFDLIFNEIMA